MNLKKGFLLILLICNCTMGAAQQSSTGYTAFTKTPSRVSKSLLDSLKNESNAVSRFRLIDSIARIHLQFGETDSIISYGQMLEREVEFNKEELVNNPFWLTRAYYLIGRGKQLNGLFDAALGYHLRAQKLGIDDEEFSYLNQLGLARAYFNKRELEKALPLLQTVYDNSNDLSTSAKAAFFTSLIYNIQGEQAKSDELFADALDRAEQAEDNKLRMIIELTEIELMKLQKYDEVVFNKLEEIKDKALKAEYYDVYTEAVIAISKLFILAGNVEDAEMVLSIAHINTVSWNRWQLEQKMQLALKKFFVEQGDYKNAYAIMTQYTALNERIINNQNYNAVKELEVQYETDIKEKEIDRQRLIKNSLLIGFLVLLIPVIALLITYYQKLKTQIALNESQEIVNQQEVTALLKDQELKLIKASITGENKERKRIARELHDSIGGNLASIKLQLAYKETESPIYKDIAKQLDDTYNQVRDLSHNLTTKKFEQNVFTELVSEYVQNINSATDTEISFHPHPVYEVNTIKQRIQVEIFKVIQELLTNALKHSKATSIEIHLNVYNNKLTMLFEDDGVGFDSNTVILGVGLNNMKNRIINMSGTMLIDAIPRRGTVINIEIPV